MPRKHPQTPAQPAPASTPAPQPESPRARLLKRGPAALADAEVIALLLRTGGRESSALSIAHDLLDSLGGLSGLLGATAGRLRRKGIGEARASVLTVIRNRCIPVISLVFDAARSYTCKLA